MSSAMYGWGGEAFFCPRRLPSWENARGERWPYAGAPLTIRIYVEATLTIHIYVYTHHSPYIYTHHSPYAGTPLSHYSSSAPKQPHLWLPTIHTVTWVFSRSPLMLLESKRHLFSATLLMLLHWLQWLLKTKVVLCQQSWLIIINQQSTYIY